MPRHWRMKIVVMLKSVSPLLHASIQSGPPCFTSTSVGSFPAYALDVILLPMRSPRRRGVASFAQGVPAREKELEFESKTQAHFVVTHCLFLLLHFKQRSQTRGPWLTLSPLMNCRRWVVTLQMVWSWLGLASLQHSSCIERPFQIFRWPVIANPEWTKTPPNMLFKKSKFL